MSEVMKKCLRCGSDILEGQKFCMECGAAQKVKMRSREEIIEMKKQIRQIRPSRDSEMGTLLYILTTYAAMDTILTWVLGLENDKKIFNLLKAKTSREKI